MSRKERPVLGMGDRIGSYTVVRLLGQGGYGDIYAAEKDETKVVCAIKTEQIKSEKQGLQFEILVMEKLQDSSLFPKLHEKGRTDTHLYFVMELLGPSVSNTRRQMMHHHYSLGTTLRLGVFMLRAIREFHQHGFIHRDIKPGNFLLRPSQTNPLVLIDFGLSREFIDPRTGRHYPERSRCGFRGTSKYASIRAHDSKDLSWRDDLISWMYSMIELIEGRLPWLSGCDFERTRRMKMTTTSRTLFGALPGEFLDMWRHVNSLGFGDRPDYDYIEDLLLRAMAKNAVTADMPFDWEFLRPSVVRELSAIPELPRASETAARIQIPYTLHAASEGPEHSRCGTCTIC